MTLEKEQSKVSTNFLIIMVISILPLILMFIYYLTSPDSIFFVAIGEITQNIPSNVSSKNIPLSKAMDAYSKTAPLFSLGFILWNYKSLTLHVRGKDMSQIVGLILIATILFIIGFYLYFLSNHDLASSGKLLRMMASNDLTLAAYYIISYAGMFSIITVYLWVILKIYPTYKRKY